MRHVILVFLLVGSLAIAPVAVGDDGGGFLSIREWVVEVWNSLMAGLIPPGDHEPGLEPGGTEFGPAIDPGGVEYGPVIDPGGLKSYDPEPDFGPGIDPGGYSEDIPDPELEHGPGIDPGG